MKKMILKAMMMSAMLFIGAHANAQSVGDVLGAVLNSGNSNTTDVINGLTSIFSSKKQASSTSIVGTWSYSEPAILFSSDNLLAKAGAKIASSKMEKKLQDKLGQYGIKPGSLTFDFKKDGTFTATLNKKTTTGKWSVSNSKLQLTTVGIRPVSITTQLEGSEMMFVTDATKLLNFFKTMGAKSNNANLKTVTTLMKSVNGMQVGVTMKKK